MKKIILLCLILFCTILQSQNFILDTSFGNNGTVFNNGINFRPKSGLLINNSYFLISGNTIAKIQYNGAFNTSFGTNGFITMNNSTETYEIANFKFLNNSIYIYGKVTVGTNADLFICKMDENGNFDSGFGINGFCKINWGLNETLSDFSLDNDGNFYCVGSRYSPILNSAGSKMIYFKINPNGTLNTAFDPNGYKEFLINNATAGSLIIPYQNNFILAGNSLVTSTGTSPYSIMRFLLTKVDNNGAVVSSFGTNGSVVTDYGSGTDVNNLRKVVLASNKLYFSYYCAASFATQGGRVMMFNLNTNQVGYDEWGFFDNDIANDGSDNLYVAGATRCTNEGFCQRDFSMQKLAADGTLDSNFAASGMYTYSFPKLSRSDDSSTVLIRESNSKFLLAGYVIRDYYDASNQYTIGSGFSMIRIGDSTLEISDSQSSTIMISPNPFSDFITITSDYLIKSILLFDINGRMLYEPAFDFVDNTTQIKLTNLNSGLYFIKVNTTDGRTFVRKILK